MPTGSRRLVAYLFTVVSLQVSEVQKLDSVLEEQIRLANNEVTFS